MIFVVKWSKKSEFRIHSLSTQLEHVGLCTVATSDPMVRFLRGGSYSDARGPRSLQSLPVRDGELQKAIEYYTSVFGFTLVASGESESESGEHQAQQCQSPRPAAALLQRDDLTMGLEENGGDPTQEGAFIEVDDIDGAFAELQANGLGSSSPNFTLDWRPASGDEPSYCNKVFFVIAPDGLCYCLGHRVTDLVREGLPLVEADRWALLPPSPVRDGEVHALFNTAEVMLPFLKHLYDLPDDQWSERRQRHRAGFANLDEGPLYMDLIWKETGWVRPCSETELSSSRALAIRLCLSATRSSHATHTAFGSIRRHCCHPQGGSRYCGVPATVRPYERSRRMGKETTLLRHL